MTHNGTLTLTVARTSDGVNIVSDLLPKTASAPPLTPPQPFRLTLNTPEDVRTFLRVLTTPVDDVQAAEPCGRLTIAGRDYGTPELWACIYLLNDENVVPPLLQARVSLGAFTPSPNDIRFLLDLTVPELEWLRTEVVAIDLTDLPDTAEGRDADPNDVVLRDRSSDSREECGKR